MARAVGGFRLRTDAPPAGRGTEDEVLRALMIAAQGGDKASYAKLLSACEPLIRRNARRVGADAAWIDDIVQETLLTLHGARQTYDPSRSFTAWLTTISQRRAIDAMRRSGRRKRREVHAPVEYENHADPLADASSSWREAAQAHELERAVSELTAGQKQAVELLAMQGRTLAEASTETGRTKGALKVNFHRAMEALRRRVGGGEIG